MSHGGFVEPGARAVKFARKARENENRSREKNKLLLDGFQFIFLVRDSENDLYRIYLV